MLSLVLSCITGRKIGRVMFKVICFEMGCDRRNRGFEKYQKYFSLFLCMFNQVATNINISARQ